MTTDERRILYVKGVAAATVRDIDVLAASDGVPRAEIVERIVRFYRAAQAEPKTQAGKLLAQ